MIKVTFDAPTLADAIGKAARIAPTKGAAYDLAAGILITVDTTAHRATIATTNLDLTYRQVLDTQDCKGASVTWRIPSSLLSGLLATLPLGAGSTITFYDKGDGSIRLTSGTTAAMIHTLSPEDFPKVDEFDVSVVSEAHDFAAKVAQVSWACAKDNSILSGVHIDGESLIGCDRNVAAIVPCKVPVKAGVTVPLFLLAPVLRSATDVRVGADPMQLFISLDAESQSTGRILVGEYPKVKALRRDNFTGFAMVGKNEFVEVVNRLMVMARSERLPTMTMEFRTGLVKQVILDLEVPDKGRIQDRIDLGGEFEDDFTITITPSQIISAVENAHDQTVRIDFGNSTEPAKAALSSMRVTDDTGYEALMMPRRKG